MRIRKPTVMEVQKAEANSDAGPLCMYAINANSVAMLYKADDSTRISIMLWYVRRPPPCGALFPTLITR